MVLSKRVLSADTIINTNNSQKRMVMKATGTCEKYQDLHKSLVHQVKMIMLSCLRLDNDDNVYGAWASPRIRKPP